MISKQNLCCCNYNHGEFTPLSLDTTGEKLIIVYLIVAGPRKTRWYIQSGECAALSGGAGWLNMIPHQESGNLCVVCI